jgi:Domain of unknown function (DUF4159)
VRTNGIYSIDETIELFDKNNKLIASFNLKKQEQNLELPKNLARATNYFKIKNQSNAGAIYFIDGANRRPIIMTQKADNNEQPLLSDTHFINAALNSIGDIVDFNIFEIEKTKPNAIIFGDISGFTISETFALNQYLRQGGNIIRFLGPKSLNNEKSDFLTAPISLEPHIISSGFAVEKTQIKEFEANSIFKHIKIPNDINIQQTILFKNGSNPDKILISLSDGAPLLSQKIMNGGKLYMFHTSAAPIWSDIGLSNLQLDFLKAILANAQTKGPSADILEDGIAMRPSLLIGVDGAILKSFNNLKPIFTPILPQISANNEQKPGIYEANGASYTLNFGTNQPQLSLQAKPSDFVEFAKPTQIISLDKYFYALGLLLLIGDILINLLRDFKFKSLKKLRFLALVIFALFLYPNISKAQEIGQKSDDLRLSYLQTQDAKTNEQARVGLLGLARELQKRTNVEPHSIIEINPDKDDLAKQPIIYWLLPPNPAPLSENAKLKLNNFMRHGGILFIDTRGKGMDKKRAQALLQNSLNGMVIPPLEKVPLNHVLGKSFYLLNNFSGFYQNSNLWVESSASSNQSANDGVSPIIISDGDFARAWAQSNHLAKYGLNDDNITREMPYRVGINIYLYALSGQYKTDQVHIRTLLNRIKKRGQ